MARHFISVEQPVEILGKKELAIIVKQPRIRDRAVGDEFRKIDIKAVSVFLQGNRVWN